MTRTLFEGIQIPVSKLIEDIDAGEIALPEIQRPFVWEARKVRDLFDSMYRGYPVGYLLFWTNAPNGARQIGVGDKQFAARRMIVDGQQRLTSLYTVIKGALIVREDYTQTRLRIAFRPRDGTFAVANAATVRDPEFIPDISALWAVGSGVFQFAREFMERLGASRELSPDEQRQLENAISDLHGLQGYLFSALELNSSIDEEQVAEIFVRINSEGVSLNQADFILTLMSVWWDDGRRQLEEFSRLSRQPSAGRPSPFNHYLQPDPDQLLRVAIGLGFRRGQLRHVLSLLRGRDLETGQFSAASREAQFRRLRDAQAQTLNLTHWHDFLKVLVRAGFRSSTMLTSETNILYAYVFYLVGRVDFHIDEYELRELIARWFFMSALSGRYSSSPESTVESDLAQLRGKTTPAEFRDVLDRIISDTLTDDYWEITLPNSLTSSAAWSPTLFAYYASLNLLDARVLFSKMRVSELFDPALKAHRTALERHHLFPRAYLESIDVTAQTERNQIANYALVEWPDNAAISSTPPADYFPELFARLDEQEQDRARFWHALPDDWENMEYQEFLAQRRRLMAAVVREGFDRLVRGDVSGEDVVDEAHSTAELLAMDEGQHLELKSSARWNLHTQARDAAIEAAIVKTVAGFMNGSGGTLLIGVSDQHEVVGLEQDYQTVQKGDRDRFESWLTTLFDQYIGKAELAFLKVSFEAFDGKDICRVDVKAASYPVFVHSPKGGSQTEFYVRYGNSTRQLGVSDFQKYTKDRWPNS